MIKYRLICQKSHEFEGWFSSSKSFDSQVKKKLVTCPICGTAKVEKAIMSPSVVTSERKAKKRQLPAQAAEAASPAEPSHVMMTPDQRKLLQEMRKMRDAILDKSDYVGPRFAEEARRIHSEESGDAGGAKDSKAKKKPRGIYGEATPAEVKSLAEDGIEVFPVPVLPEDHN